MSSHTHTHREKILAQNSLAAAQEDKEKLNSRVSTLEGELKKLRNELEEEREKEAADREGSQVIEGPGGLKLTRLELVRVLRERNEYKEKYLSLLEQIR